MKRRYRDLLAGGACREVDENLIYNTVVLEYDDGGRIECYRSYLNGRLSDGTLVELPSGNEAPDDASQIIHVWIDEAADISDEMSNAISGRIKQSRCTSHTWVNYTPYHDASPMAKFACSRCNADKVK